MQRFIKLKLWYFLVPLVFVTFHILFLYSVNIDFVKFSEIILPFLIVLGGAVVITAILTLIFKEKGPLLATVLLFFLLVFNHFNTVVNDLLEYIDKTFSLTKTYGMTYRFIEYNFFPVLWVIIFIGISLLLIFKLKNTKNAIKILLFIFSVMLGVSLVNIAIFGFSNNQSLIEKEKITINESDSENNITQDEKLNPTYDVIDDVSSLPDIYYIIPDGYARADVLKEFYGYDNSDFLSGLEELGFFIADKSTTNYTQTALSLASSLNLNYLQNLIDNIDPRSGNRTILKKMIKDNKVKDLLRDIGYIFVTIDSGYGYTNITESDVYLNKEMLSSFDVLVYNTSYLYLLFKRLVTRETYIQHTRRVNFSLEVLQEVAKEEQPTFTFLHFINPHPPFIFNEDGTINEQEISEDYFGFGDADHYLMGRKLTSKDYQERYVRQLKYINQKILNTMKGVLENSDTPPIIILQADHGPGSKYRHNKYIPSAIKERQTILNAYYFPYGGSHILTQDVTPVNTFRILFNYYFGKDYEILENNNYSSIWGRPYNFTKVKKELLD